MSTVDANGDYLFRPSLDARLKDVRRWARGARANMALLRGGGMHSGCSRLLEVYERIEAVITEALEEDKQVPQ